MHRPRSLLVLGSFFAAGSMGVAAEEEGIPVWVWPVLIIMLGFLVWWWLRKPVEEVSGPAYPGQTDRTEISSSRVSPVIVETPQPPTRSRTIAQRISRGPTPQPLTAESSAPSELEEGQDQKLPKVPPLNVKPDDLSIVEGIGPKINQVLHAAGIQSLAQLEDSDAAVLKEILTSAGVRLADPTTWPEQARLAAAGDMETLKALQASLKGGRKVTYS
jgi:predicted flap endonuclease-1-like 5' DNA nuclease